MDALKTNPDFAWYADISSRHSLSPRCPFASVERCPRYYQSLSLLGEAGFTKIAPAEDDRLIRKWKGSDLWPRTDEQATGILGSTFANFCPEVSYDGFGYFASSLSRYADEIDSDFAHARLGKMHAPASDWRWRWAHVRPMHFIECPIYSALRHQGPSSKMPIDESKRAYLEKKLASTAAEVVEDSLRAVIVAQGEATKAGALGNSRAYLIYNDAVFEVMKAVLPRMARMVYHATEGASEAAANLLDAAASKMVADIAEALDKKFRQAAKAYGDSPLVDQLTAKLTRAKDQVVEDFKHGMDGDVPLTKQQTGNVYVTQTNSPAGQIAVGNQNIQSIQQQSSAFIKTIEDVLASDGFKELNNDKAEVVRTLADLVREELQKPSADKSKVKSWIERMGTLIQAGGLVAEGAKILGALSDWLSAVGP
jgi:hypothetical protein